MSGIIDGKRRFNDAEIVPRALGSVPSGTDGQLAPVSDQGAVALMVRQAGLLVPTVKTATTEPIFMVVDRLTGTSPPAGTVVTNQAQYDALGYNLKLPQDALRILPPVLGDYVRVRCVAGEHWADPTTSYVLMMTGKLFDITGKSLTVADPVVGTISRPSIVFYGDTSIHTASQSGTYTAPRSIACPTGTWATNELQGKFVWFLTGSGAGSKIPIRSNTATTIELAGLLTAGSGTFEVRQNDSVFMPTTDGSNTSAGYFDIRNPAAVQRSPLWIFDMTIGSASKRRALATQEYTTLVFYRCVTYVGVTGNYAANIAAGLTYYWGHIFIDSTYNFSVYCKSNVAYIFSTMIRGTITATGDDFPALITVADKGHLKLSDCVLEPAGTYAGAMLSSREGWLIVRRDVLIDGLGQAKGIFLGGPNQSIPEFASEAILINNCTTALTAKTGTRLINGAGFAGTGNTKVFEISGGAHVEWAKSGLTATGTTYATIDGVDYPSSDFANAGDGVEGQYGSSLDMT